MKEIPAQCEIMAIVGSICTKYCYTTVLCFDLQTGKTIGKQLRTENALFDKWRDDETYASMMWYLAVITRQDNAKAIVCDVLTTTIDVCFSDTKDVNATTPNGTGETNYFLIALSFYVPRSNA